MGANVTLKVFWTPAGLNLDQVGDKRFVDLSDGDTPNIRMNIRMLSIDTPEKDRTATIGVAQLDQLFAEVADWIEAGENAPPELGPPPVSARLGQSLLPRLRRANAASAHVAQGRQASDAHSALIRSLLTRPSGRLRNLFVRIADDPFDQYGRLLAYVAPNYSEKERAAMTRLERATFNYRMVELGWAAPFIIFPSIPGELDLPEFQRAARHAYEQKAGAWADPLALAAYEFRAVERLCEVLRDLKMGKKVTPARRHGWIHRYCADMTTAEIFSPQEYVRVEPYNRLFIWETDVRRAVSELNLTPAGVLVA